jgi:hypothetical protein
MTTLVRFKASELNKDIFNRLQALLINAGDAEVTITVDNKKPFVVKETKAEYKKRLTGAIENAESGKNLVSFSPKEFATLTDRLLKK